MDFNKQGKSLSNNAQLLVMSVRDSDRAKFDAEKFYQKNVVEDDQEKIL